MAKKKSASRNKAQKRTRVKRAAIYNSARVNALREITQGDIVDTQDLMHRLSAGKGVRVRRVIPKTKPVRYVRIGLKPSGDPLSGVITIVTRLPNGRTISEKREMGKFFESLWRKQFEEVSRSSLTGRHQGKALGKALLKGVRASYPGRKQAG